MRFLKRAFLTILIVGVGFFVFLLIFPPYCMVEGTQVDTPSGSCNIEDLSEGEEVWTRAPSGELQVGRIRAIHPAWSMVQSMIVLSDGTTLNATAPHPVATETGWKPAGQLETGDSVWSRDGWRKVASVTHTGGLVRVFDLEVEPNSNFFANGVLVHNKSKRFTNEDSAVSAVRNIVTSQITYSATIGEGSYATSLTQLENAKLVDSVLGSGTKDGYTFRTTADKDTFTITARPLSHGDRNFYSDETGVIRYTREDRPAWFRDPPLGQ